MKYLLLIVLFAACKGKSYRGETLYSFGGIEVTAKDTAKMQAYRDGKIDTVKFLNGSMITRTRKKPIEVKLPPDTILPPAEKIAPTP